MRPEALGWFVAATSFYAFVILISLMRTKVIDYSPFDLALGVALGLFVVGLISAFLAGAAIIIHEATTRQHQLWL